MGGGLLNGVGVLQIGLAAHRKWPGCVQGGREMSKVAGARKMWPGNIEQGRVHPGGAGKAMDKGNGVWWTCRPGWGAGKRQWRGGPGWGRMGRVEQGQAMWNRVGGDVERARYVLRGLGGPWGTV